MEHEEHTSPEGNRFGNNTNPFGILIVALVGVFLAIFCWNFWKSGAKENEHYRYDQIIGGSDNPNYESGRKPGRAAHETLAFPHEDSTHSDSSHVLHSVDSTHADSAAAMHSNPPAHEDASHEGH